MEAPSCVCWLAAYPCNKKDRVRLRICDEWSCVIIRPFKPDFRGSIQYINVGPKIGQNFLFLLSRIGPIFGPKLRPKFMYIELTPRAAIMRVSLYRRGIKFIGSKAVKGWKARVVIKKITHYSHTGEKTCEEKWPSLAWLPSFLGQFFYQQMVRLHGIGNLPLYSAPRL